MDEESHIGLHVVDGEILGEVAGRDSPADDADQPNRFQGKKRPTQLGSLDQLDRWE